MDVVVFEIYNTIVLCDSGFEEVVIKKK